MVECNFDNILAPSPPLARFCEPCPIAGLADELNQIYASYAMKWEVTLDESFIGITLLSF